MRAQLRHRLERPAPLVRTQQDAQTIGRPGRPARLLELEPGPVHGQLQLPDAAPALRPPAQRDAGARERAVGRVVVDRRENARLERLAAEIGEDEPLRRFELAFVLDGRLHGGDDISARPPTRRCYRTVTEYLPTPRDRRRSVRQGPPSPLQ